MFFHPAMSLRMHIGQAVFHHCKMDPFPYVPMGGRAVGSTSGRWCYGDTWSMHRTCSWSSSWRERLSEGRLWNVHTQGRENLKEENWNETMISINTTLRVPTISSSWRKTHTQAWPGHAQGSRVHAHTHTHTHAGCRGSSTANHAYPWQPAPEPRRRVRPFVQSWLLCRRPYTCTSPGPTALHWRWGRKRWDCPGSGFRPYRTQFAQSQTPGGRISRSHDLPTWLAMGSPSAPWVLGITQSCRLRDATAHGIALWLLFYIIFMFTSPGSWDVVTFP